MDPPANMARSASMGQMAVMTRAPLSTEIAGMAEQEAEHKARFDRLIAGREVRPPCSSRSGR